MKTRKLRKFLMLLASALLLVSVTVGATVAYLTAQTEVVTNTFTVGNVALTLNESKVDLYGVKDETADPVMANTYKLIPGHTYTKDPTVHITAGSENGWLFVKVDNGIAGIEDATTIAAQMTAIGWNAVAGETGVYAYKEIVKACDNVKVFESFKIKGDANVAAYNGETITVQAYMVQADTFTSAEAAWTAAPLAAWKAPSAQ